ncbi:MAG: hypothetical protein WCR55_13405 [Lentisphaerota bacterium]
MKTTVKLIAALTFITTAALGYELDVNYMDHGLVNLDGKVITTKYVSYLVSDFQAIGAPYFKGWANSYDDNSKAGEKVGSYTFKMNGNELYVTDSSSGVSKHTKVDATRVRNNVIFTVLRGYETDFWSGFYDIADPWHFFHDESIKSQFRLLVANDNKLDYYDVNVTAAFEKG